MNGSLKRVATVLVLGAVGMGSWHLGSTLVRDVQHARAQERVEIAREHLAKVDDLAAVFRGVGKAVEPSVVFLEVTKTAGASSLSDLRRNLPFDDETLRRFFPDRDGDGEPDLPEQDGGRQQGQGSGVIMEADGSSGWILTNNHVAGGASEIKVTLHDGREIKNARVIGTDPKTDLAVVKIEADRLIPAVWGDSDTLAKGDIVMAFGAPFGYVGSMTHGIVSALNRQAGILGNTGYENFIQVDCPINPGNSGGPLVNTRGEVVGINTAILSRNGGFQGVGFSIPSNQAKFVYGQLKSGGKVSRGWLGVSISNLSAQPGLGDSFGFSGTKGVIVNEVMDGPAEGKLQDGDIILSIDGKPTDSMNDLRNTVAKIAPDSTVTIKVWRDSKEQEVQVTLGEQPTDLAVASRRGSGGRGEGGASPGESRTTAERLGLRLTTPSASQLQRFGLSADDVSEGALVTNVNRESPAFAAGIRPGDVITRIGNQEVRDVDQALEALSGADLKAGIRMHVASRDGKRFVFLRDER